MKAFLIKSNNKYFSSFGNTYNKRGQLSLKPIYGTKDMALLFHSHDDATRTAARVNGSVVQVSI